MPGKPLSNTVSIHWTGEADQYAISTPDPSLPEGISMVGVSSYSFSKGEETYLIYTMKLSTNKTGSFEPIPISLSVYDKGEKAPSTMIVKTEPFTVGDRKWKGIPTRYFILAGLAGVALLAIGIIFQRGVSRKRRTHQNDQEEHLGENLWNLLSQGRAFLVRGDFLSFLETVLTIERSFQEKDPDTLSVLLALTEKVRYGGHRPQPEELERMYRGLKLRLQQKFPQETRDQQEM